MQNINKHLPDCCRGGYYRLFVFYFYSYTPVYECVSSFLNKAEEQEGKVAAIMSLGAAKDLTIHYQPSGYTHTHTYTHTHKAGSKTLLSKKNQKLIKASGKCYICTVYLPSLTVLKKNKELCMAVVKLLSSE